MTGGGRGGIKALIALVAIGAFFAAAGYAATRHGPVRGPDRKAQPGRLPKPTITDHPQAQETSMSAKFGFTARRAGTRFECRLDQAPWRTCSAPVLFSGLTVGPHRFLVRARDRRRRKSAAARFRWTVLTPKNLTIAADLSRLGSLYPGAPPLELRLTVGNPNPVPVFVTDLRVSVSADPTGCAGAENLALGQSNASAARPLKIPAGGSVRLPSRDFRPPTIQLRDLPLNQDACRGARFPLEFHGSAYG